MPWRPLPQIAFGIARSPFQPVESVDLPLELGDELYIIEEGGNNWEWFRGYLVAPPSLIAGLTSVKGQALEARVFSGIFPRNCVEIKEYLGATETSEAQEQGRSRAASESRPSLQENRYNLAASLNGVPRKQQQQPQNMGTNSSIMPQPIIPIKTPASPSSVSFGADGKRQRPPAPVPMLKIGDETPTSASEPLVDEIASCLREWHSTHLHELLLSREYGRLNSLSKLFNQLELARRQLMHGVLTEEELEVLREKTVWDLVRGNQMLKNDIVVRDPNLRGRLLHEHDDPIEISRLQSTMSLLTEPPKLSTDAFVLHHLLVETRNLENTRTDSPKIVLYLASRKGDGPLVQLSESFMMEVPTQDHLQRGINSGKLRTLFTNLTPTDIGSTSGSDARVYLVIKVQVNHVPLPPSPRLPSVQRSGTISKDPPRDRLGTPTSASGGKGGRKSMLFGSRSTGSPRSRDTRIDSIAESNDTGSNATGASQGSEQLQAAASTTEAAKYVKRFVGTGIVSLNELLAENGESDRTIAIWSPDESLDSTDSPKIEETALIQQIQRSPSQHWGPLKGLSHIDLHLHSFISSDPDELVRKTPTLLHNITQTPRIGFSGAPKSPRSDIYITIVEPKMPPGALFLHPDKGGVEMSGVAEMRNLQLTLEVRKDDGERIARCIFPSSESSGQTAWRSTAIRLGEHWKQTFRLSIPVADVSSCHIIMSIAEFSEFPFALAWIPLWSEDAFIHDGAHSPTLYLYDQKTSHAESGRGAYLDLPWNSRNLGQSRPSSLTGPIASVKLESYLCSTHFSQDQCILRLLQWREENDDQMLVLLRQVAFVPEIELVKQVNEVLDALFGVLVDKTGHEEYEDLAFAAIVIVLAIVHDRRFGLEPVIDEYAESRFDFPAAVPGLIQSYLRLIGAPGDYQNSRQLRATFKVGKQIMRFIIMARKQQVQKEKSIGIINSQTTFNMDLKQVFVGFEQRMNEDSAASIGSKTLIVQHMHTWLPELAPVFTQDQILKAASSFLEACSSVEGKLVLHKLVLIYNVLNMGIANPSPYLPKFKERVMSWLDPYWGLTDEVTEQYREQVRLCCSVVSLMRGQYGPLCSQLFEKIPQSYFCIVKSERPTGQALSLLFPSTYPFPFRPFKGERDFDECLIELAALRATLSHEDLVQPDESKDLDLLELADINIEMNLSIQRSEAFPATWLTLHTFHHRSCFDRLAHLRPMLLAGALPSPEEADQFPTELWRKYITATLSLVRSPSLSLETFAEQKRRAVWKICGDIRERGAGLLLQVWNDLGWETDEDERERFGLDRLGGYQVQYVPSLVAPVVELCLSVHEGLRRAAVAVLHSMIVGEWSLNEDLSVIQAEIIDCLDTMSKIQSSGESAQHRVFIQQLSELFEPLQGSSDGTLWTAVRELVLTVDQMLDLLFAVNAPEQNESSEIMHTLRLMEFLKGVNKHDMFIRYIHKLSATEMAAGNLKEAGLALHLHANIYSWDTEEMLEPLADPVYPRQTSFERREQIFFQIIQLFEEAQAWAPALSCYKELAEQYEEEVQDFPKLARAQRSMAKIYDQIARGHVETPRFFRVVYRGHGFPPSLKDKTFIFESANTEKLATFVDKLQEQYPSAQVSSQEETDIIEGQYIYVATVTPHQDLDSKIWQRQKLSHSTKEFLASVGTCKFAAVIQRFGNIGGYSVEKAVYTTVNTFPTILRRSEVQSTKNVTLDPLDTALDRTLRKVAELAARGLRAQGGDEVAMKGLIEGIRDAVDLSSTNSVARYREMLAIQQSSPGETIEEQDPTLSPHQTALKIALVDYASCVRQNLSKLSRAAHQQERSALSRQFQVAFAPELAIIAPSPTTMQYAAVDASEHVDKYDMPVRSAPPVPTESSQTFSKMAESNGENKRSTIAAPPGTSSTIREHDRDNSMNGHTNHHHNLSVRSTHTTEPSDDQRSLSTVGSHVNRYEGASTSNSNASIEDTRNMQTPRKDNYRRQESSSSDILTQPLRGKVPDAELRRDSKTQDEPRPTTARRARLRKEPARPATAKTVDKRATGGRAALDTSDESASASREPSPRVVPRGQGSIRKRLSYLGLAKKPSRGQLLDGVAEDE